MIFFISRINLCKERVFIHKAIELKNFGENDVMKKRRMEFAIVIIMIALADLVFFTDIPFLWKELSIALYSVFILITVFSLILENRTAQNTLLWIYVLVFLPVLGYIVYVYSGQLF